MLDLVRFTDVTEFMIGITIQYIQYIDHVAIIIVEKAEVEMKYNIEKKRKINKDMDYNDSSRPFRPLGSRVMALSIKCVSLALRTESREE